MELLFGSYLFVRFLVLTKVFGNINAVTLGVSDSGQTNGSGQRLTPEQCQNTSQPTVLDFAAVP